MPDPNRAEFDTFNIRDDQEITAALREQAKAKYNQSFDYVWSQDGKTEWIGDMGAPIDKPASLGDWQFGTDLGTIPRYSDLNKLIREQNEFFEYATDEQLREALKSPNDMGKFAKKQWEAVIQEKNKQDQLFLKGISPDTANANELRDEMAQQKCDEMQEQIDNRISIGMEEEGVKADCKDTASIMKRAADLAAATKKAIEDMRKASAAIVPAKSLQFKQQNFLQAKLIDIIKHRHAFIDSDPERQKVYPYVEGSPNASIMLHGDPGTVINDLLIYSDTEQFLQMRSEEIANLQPEIRLFKTITNKATGKDKNVEIKFDTHLTQRSLESLLVNSKKRGTGVGIKDFRLSFVGADPFAANKSFKATLKIFANSFDELFVPRGKQGERYRYVDLALKTSKSLNEGVVNKLNAHKVGILAEDLARLDFSLKVKLGLRVPNRTVGSNYSLYDAIARNTLTLSLTPTIHRFEFNEDGSLMFEIDYLPFNEQRFGGSNFDVFTNQNMRKSILETKIRSKFARQNCMSEEADALKKQNIKDIQEIRVDAVASIIRDLHTHKRVNYIQIAPEVLKTFNQSAAELSFEEILKLSEQAEFVGAEGTPEGLKSDVTKDVEGGKKEDRIKTKINSPTVPTIPYVFISDIIDAVMAALTVGVSPLGMQTEIEKILSKMGADAESQQKLTTDIADLQRQYSRAAQDAIYGENLDGVITEEEEAKLDKLAFQVEMGERNVVESEELRDMAYDMLEEYKKDFEDFRKFRVVLGPVELVNPFNSDDVLIASIGDIPVSISYLQEWLTSETLKDGVTRLSLSAFLNRLIMKLVKNCLNDDSSFGGALKQKVRVAKTEALCVNQYDGKMDDLTYNMVQTNRVVEKNAKDLTEFAMSEDMSYYQERYIKEALGLGADEQKFKTSRAYLNYLSTPVLNSAESGDDPAQPDAAEREMNYLIFYSGRTPPIGTYRGDRGEDSKRAVHHYSVGRDRGIIKTISLTRDSRPGIREARFEMEGYDGLQQLREVYNVDVKCFANFNVFPGTKIFVDPRGWVPNIDSETLSQLGSVDGLTEFGIGGYHEVMKVEHIFGVGQFDTEFTAKWTMSSAPPKPKIKGGKPNEKDASRCKTEAGIQESQLSAAANVKDMMEKAGSALSSAAPRITALVNPIFETVTSGAGGVIDRVADFFGNPSDAP